MYDYNYEEAVRNDLKEMVEENLNHYRELYEQGEDMFEKIYNDALEDDSVTGNASGSYWFSSYKAEEALCHNYFDYKKELEEDFGYLPDDPETADVMIRCYVLNDVIYDVLKEYFKEY